MTKTIPLILLVISDWLAVLSLSIFAYAFFIKMNKLFIENVNMIFYTSLFLVLVFIITGRISARKLRNTSITKIL